MAVVAPVARPRLVLADDDLVAELVADDLGGHLDALRGQLGLAVAPDERAPPGGRSCSLHGKPVHDELLALLDAVLLPAEFDDRVRHKNRRGVAPDVHCSQMPTRAVVFDLYGTLIDDAPPSDYARFLAETARVIGADPERFRVAWEANDVARYTGPIETCFESVCADLGVLDFHAALELRLERMRALLVPRPDAVATLQTLRERGLRLGMISNASSELSGLWAESALAPLFDAALFSADEGMMKPDLRLYERMAELLGVDAGGVRLRRRRRLPRAPGRRGGRHDRRSDPCAA